MACFASSPLLFATRLQRDHRRLYIHPSSSIVFPTSPPLCQRFQQGTVLSILRMGPGLTSDSVGEHRVRVCRRYSLPNSNNLCSQGTTKSDAANCTDVLQRLQEKRCQNQSPYRKILSISVSSEPARQSVTEKGKAPISLHTKRRAARNT